MELYILIACDRLEEAQENKLKADLPAIQARLQSYAEDCAFADGKFINECDSEFCDDWQLGISQRIKKKPQLKFPIEFFNDLAKEFKVDCEVGEIEDGQRNPAL
ncbi:hypothetical protein [Salinibius halmophilus]|uniref:hypothetical protein n=1 Tax=Salinibius halmophilus TaxID=1853216 RepID=UPI000E665599|nr:hypothetical protein [Salinibius halmophilus]